jgi:hypothetical protein
MASASVASDSPADTAIEVVIHRATLRGAPFTLIYFPVNNIPSYTILINFIEEYVVDRETAQRNRKPDVVVNRRLIEMYPPHYYYGHGDPALGDRFDFFLIKGGYGHNCVTFLINYSGSSQLSLHNRYNGPTIVLEDLPPAEED